MHVMFQLTNFIFFVEKFDFILHEFEVLVGNTTLDLKEVLLSGHKLVLYVVRRVTQYNEKLTQVIGK